MLPMKRKEDPWICYAVSERRRRIIIIRSAPHSWMPMPAFIAPRCRLSYHVIQRGVICRARAQTLNVIHSVIRYVLSYSYDDDVTLCESNFAFDRCDAMINRCRC